MAGDSTVVTVFRDQQVWAEALVNAEHPAVRLDADGAHGIPSTWMLLLRFGREGIGHIFGGIDHVLFLFSLLLLGGGVRQLLKIVTAFTLAHSLTLSLAATGTLTLPPRLVEPVIALSILVVALSNLRRAPDNEAAKPLGRFDVRPWMAFGFGLIHGFGFAGALAEVGLPRESLGVALLAFNLGVEIGQATLVLAFAPLLAGLAFKWPRARAPIVHWSSVAIACVGAF